MIAELSEAVPRHVPAGVALCLFRIAQEALQNVVKHSGATTATVRFRTGNRPSGTFATMMPIANTKLSQNGRSNARPITKSAAPSSTESTAIRRLRLVTSR